MNLNVPTEACRKFAEVEHPFAYGSPQRTAATVAEFAGQCRALMDTAKPAAESAPRGGPTVCFGGSVLLTRRQGPLCPMLALSDSAGEQQYTYAVLEKSACVKVFAQVYRRLRAAYGFPPLF